jgi:site-specific recombinase XerD
MIPIAPHITAYLQEHLPRERNVSPHTTETYAYAFQLLFEYASQALKVAPSDLTFEQLDAPLIRNFLCWLEESRGNAISSRNTRLAAIKAFMHFMESRAPAALEQIRKILAIPAKKTESRLVKHLTRKELQELLNAPDPAKRCGIRDRAMLHLCFACGLRVSELIGVQLEDLTLHPQPAVLIHGKGRRQRHQPLWKETATAVRAWLAVRGTLSVPELFCNSRGQAMTRSGFEYILAKHIETAAQRCPSLSKKKVSPHCLRHSCALTILQSTKDLRKVSLWLGHASIQTTEIYTRVDPSVKLETLESVLAPKLRSGRFKATDKLLAAIKQRIVMQSARSSK